MPLPPESILAGATSIALAKLVGPSIGEVGEVLRRWTEFRLRNVSRIAENAALKADVNEEGDVPFRVAIHILEEGSLSGDDILVEYLGGVLASSRSSVGRDDRGHALVGLTSRLSSYQLRSHCIVYTIIRRLLKGGPTNVFDAEELRKEAAVFVPIGVYRAAMEFGPDEDEDVLFWHAMGGLTKEGLLHSVKAGEDVIRAEIPGFTEEGFIATPTPAGAELFLWAFGFGRQSLNVLLDSELPLPESPIEIPSGARTVADIQKAMAVDTLTQVMPSDPENGASASGRLGPAPP